MTRCTGEMLDLPPVVLIQGTETTSYQVPMDWRTGFDGAARDFVDGLLEGRQPAQDVHTARRSPPGAARDLRGIAEPPAGGPGVDEVTRYAVSGYRPRHVAMRLTACALSAGEPKAVTRK